MIDPTRRSIVTFIRRARFRETGQYIKPFLCDVKSRKDLAICLGVSEKNLCYILYVLKPENSYTLFEIPKKSGGFRQICAPNAPLKKIQKSIEIQLNELFFNEPSHIQEIDDTRILTWTNVPHGFINGRSIITNAYNHKNKKYIINVDLKDFFNQFHFGRVCGYFEKNKYFMLPHEVAIILAQLTCYNGVLPQGSPCSPIITNMICQIMDNRIYKLAKRYHLNYTRYADDITFSTNDNWVKNSEMLDQFFSELSTEITNAGFSINEKKTRIQYKDSRQTVTGLTVNKKVSANVDFYKETRAMADALYKNGEFFIGDKQGALNQLEGRFAFIDSLNHYEHIQDDKNQDGDKKARYSSREKQYRYFLFYKYFFCSDKPMIITEGWTDVVYLKSALKKYYKEYPSLISYENDKFIFHIHFLKKSKKFKYFFNLNDDGGGDSISSFCKSFSPYDSKECYEYLHNKSQKDAANPIIILLDNEKDKHKPLHIFLTKKKELNIRPELENELHNQPYWGRAYSTRNLYVATIPKPIKADENDDYDIEKLFPKKTLNTKITIDGVQKTFDDKLSKNKEDKTHYGKKQFAKYIAANYEKISFSQFKPLLNNFVNIIEDYERSLDNSTTS